jgi:anti-sigma regulatory factor (Ser/Thr protein kinase)
VIGMTSFPWECAAPVPEPEGAPVRLGTAPGGHGEDKMRSVDPVKARFPAQPASVTAARRFVTETVLDAGAPDLLDDARLLVSELATNAVTHAHTEFTVSVHVAPAGLYVEVQDGDDAIPEAIPAARRGRSARAAGTDLMSQHGRGLRLLDAAASAWGYRGTDHGKLVWFRIDR